MEKLVIHNRELKNKHEVPNGTLIKGVKPRDLYTTQSWVGIDKASRLCDPNQPLLPCRGYLFWNHLDQARLVLGDGNTRALMAWENRTTLTFELLGLLPEGIKAFPLSHLRNQFRDLLWCINDVTELTRY